VAQLLLDETGVKRGVRIEMEKGIPVASGLGGASSNAAATFIAEMTPDRALMAAAVLQHRSFASTMRHYIHGSQHKASRYYQGAIAELLKQADHDGPPM